MMTQLLNKTDVTPTTDMSLFSKATLDGATRDKDLCLTQSLKLVKSQVMFSYPWILGMGPCFSHDLAQAILTLSLWFARRKTLVPDLCPAFS